MSDQPPNETKEGDQQLSVNVIDILPTVDEQPNNQNTNVKQKKNDGGYISDSSEEHVNLDLNHHHEPNLLNALGSSCLYTESSFEKDKPENVGSGCGESYQACILSFAIGSLFVIGMILVDQSFTVDPDNRMYEVNISYCKKLNYCSHRGICLHNRFIYSERCSCDYYIYAGKACSHINWLAIIFVGLASFFIGSAILLIFFYCVNACSKKERKYHEHLETLL